MEDDGRAKWWANELDTLLRRLPHPENLYWTDSRRALWIEAFSAMLDMIIKTVPDNEFVTPDALHEQAPEA